MSRYVLAFRSAHSGAHDPSAALFENGKLRFGVEEERLRREKHAVGLFPELAINACLDYADLSLEDVDKILLPNDPKLVYKRISADLVRAVVQGDHAAEILLSVGQQLRNHIESALCPSRQVRKRLQQIGEPLPSIEFCGHHRCHAASAFHPSPFEKALVITVDGRGEYDSTVIWEGDPDGLTRVRTYAYPNSLGHFFGAVTEYLGYHAFNGEGKIMGLAPYGEQNDKVESVLRESADFGVEYDVTGLLPRGGGANPERLEALFEHPSKDPTQKFTQFHKDLALTAQQLLEETVVELVQEYTDQLGIDTVCLAGGVALNCKMNKRVMETSCVDEVFIQPVAHDAGLPLGAGWLESPPEDVSPMTEVYKGPGFTNAKIERTLEESDFYYEKKDNVLEYTAQRIADGAIVGWFQGRQEMGPRALGNRSILADPRSSSSREYINEYVKHREKWRPFAPSIMEEFSGQFLENTETAPFMVKTFDTVPESADDLRAVYHPKDRTTRPQTVSKTQNRRFHRLISKFRALTGVPALLNTSFNDHAEPIVTTPREALHDFQNMGLNMVVLDDYIIEKHHQIPS
jgi:carbamoyltransferase